jgi:hypothetical protein
VQISLDGKLGKDVLEERYNLHVVDSSLVHLIQVKMLVFIL